MESDAVRTQSVLKPTWLFCSFGMQGSLSMTNINLFPSVFGPALPKHKLKLLLINCAKKSLFILSYTSLRMIPLPEATATRT